MSARKSAARRKQPAAAKRREAELEAFKATLTKVAADVLREQLASVRATEPVRATGRSDEQPVRKSTRPSEKTQLRMYSYAGIYDANADCGLREDAPLANVLLDLFRDNYTETVSFTQAAVRATVDDLSMIELAAAGESSVEQELPRVLERLQHRLRVAQWLDAHVQWPESEPTTALDPQRLAEVHINEVFGAHTGANG